MIMVITFRQEFREKLCSYLLEKEYEVCVPQHRQDVISLVKKKPPSVVVLDMYVAEPSGLEVLKELRQHYGGKVILLSGLSMSSLTPETMQLGVEQVIGGIQDSTGHLYLEQVEGAIKMAMESLRRSRKNE